MNDTARQELEKIRQSNGGFLRPVDVVKFARNKKTALHCFFEWDNTAAAEKWRVRQAQELIRVIVIVNEETSEKVRAFVNLKQDQKDALGYRSMVEVIDDEQLMAMLVEDAKHDLMVFSNKYQTLRKIGELNGVFEVIERTINPSITSKEDRVSA